MPPYLKITGLKPNGPTSEKLSLKRTTNLFSCLGKTKRISRFRDRQKHCCRIRGKLGLFSVSRLYFAQRNDILSQTIVCSNLRRSELNSPECRIYGVFWTKTRSSGLSFGRTSTCQFLRKTDMSAGNLPSSMRMPLGMETSAHPFKRLSHFLRPARRHHFVSKSTSMPLFSA